MLGEALGMPVGGHSRLLDCLAFMPRGRLTIRNSVGMEQMRRMLIGEFAALSSRGE